MARSRAHPETHYIDRVAWLRAAVLGANDGILSTGSIILGVASATGTHSNIIIAGVSGLVAGAMSMAAGEFVSVSSQADSERSDIDRERRELTQDPHAETEELAEIYVKRGLTRPLAMQVAEQFMQTNALEAHKRDELGLSDEMSAKPIVAALASAASFAIGGALPLLVAATVSEKLVLEAVPAASLLSLAVLGAVGAGAGGASILKAAGRVTFWGALAMGVTAGIGAAFGTTVG